MESAFDLQSTSLYALHEQQRVKGFTIQSATELLAISELLKSTIQEEKMLVIIEGLSTVLLSEKVSTTIFLLTFII